MGQFYLLAVSALAHLLLMLYVWLTGPLETPVGVNALLLLSAAFNVAIWVSFVLMVRSDRAAGRCMREFQEQLRVDLLKAEEKAAREESK